MRFDLRSSPETEAWALKKISEQLQEYITDVMQPRHYQALKNVFDINHETILTQCICLGLGRFDIIAGQERSKMHDENSHTSLHQLAVLIAMLEILEDGHSIQEIYFQDPLFSGVEKDFIQTLGYTVLEDPAACAKMTTSTFFFAPFIPYSVITDALAVAFPALYIGNSPAEVLWTIRRPETTDQWLISIVETLERFQSSTEHGEPLPRFDYHDRTLRAWTNATRVRWLKPACNTS